MAPLIEFCTSCRERMVAVACGVKILYHIMSSWRHSACNSWAFGDPRTNQQSIGICDPNLNFDPHTCISKLFILKLIRNYQHQICSSGGRFNSNTWIYFPIPVFLSITASALPSPRFLKLSIQSAPERNSHGWRSFTRERTQWLSVPVPPSLQSCVYAPHYSPLAGCR